MKDSSRPTTQTELFGTKQAAKILGVPEWRIKNFSEGAAYHLLPSVRVGSGRGGRRLYSLSDLYRMAIANELVMCGFTPEAIGRAMSAVSDAALKPAEMRIEEPRGERQGRSTLFLVRHSEVWGIKKASVALKLLKATISRGVGQLFAFGLEQVIENVDSEKERVMGRQW